MTSERFQRASAIFLAARRLGGAERADYLSRACEGDELLRDEVDRLLLHDGESSGLRTNHLGRMVSEAAEDLWKKSHSGAGQARRSSDGEGRRVGRYRLIRKIGEGGMGAVYEAEQDNPRRIVALKLVRPGLMSRDLLRRFELETQVLGRLHHPGIAQIFEAGTDDSGDGAQPYFAMELVNGPPLIAYAERSGLGMRERLELIARVCDAVEHAHQKGVIHRDLKPANVLVVDDAPTSSVTQSKSRDITLAVSAQPKVLDFGVARAVDSDVQATTLHTDAGQLIGTLAYMSPEQIAADPAAIDTRSDVYALGVMLYELLAGRLPHDVRNKPVPEAARIIGQEDPTPLSSIHRMFRGDVETIVAKALEKDRSRRYQSASELAADLRRCLRDEPIVARPAGSLYQFGKFARRNKALVGGAIAVFAALVLGIIGTSVGLNRALDQAAKARKMNDYLKGMIGWLDPSETGGKEITLRQLLDEASSRVDSELTDEPEIASELRHTIGAGYATLEAFGPAEDQLAKALAAREAIFGPDSEKVAETLDRLCWVWQSTGRTDLAEEGYRRQLAIYRATLGDLNPETVQSVADLAHAYQVQGKRELCDPLIAEAQSMAARLTGLRTVAASNSLESIANFYNQLGKFTEAEPLYHQSLSIRLAAQGREDMRTIVIRRNLSTLLRLQRRYDDAEPISREALEVSRKIFGNRHVCTALSINNLADVLYAKGQPAECEKLCRESLEIRAALVGEDAPEYATALGNIALMLRDQNRCEEALPMIERAIEIARRHRPQEDQDIINKMLVQASCLVALDRVAEAEPILRHCLKVREKGIGAGSTSTANLRSMLGEAVSKQGRYAEAEPLLVGSYEFLRDAKTVAPSKLATAKKRVADLYERWGRPDDAAKYQP